MMQLWVWFMVGVALGAVIAVLYCRVWLIRKYVLLTSFNELKEEKQQMEIDIATQEAALRQIAARKQELDEARINHEHQYTALLQELNKMTGNISRLETELKHKDEQLASQTQEVVRMKEQMESEFKLLANDILEVKAQSFHEQQEKNLNTLLHPFREQIAGFKKDFEERFTNEVREKSSLRAEIANLLSLNQTIAKEAISLTEALRGSTKKQGDWGEGILERILEYSGLQEGIHYSKQQSSRDANGQLLRPDLVVRFPGSRFLVIDSKVSLTHYWDFCNTQDELEQRLAIKGMVRSLRQHIDGLAGKAYVDIAGTPDFIIMFVAVEAAYITALQHDHELWEYAYARKILLISPTNLIPATKMIRDLWQQDSIHKDAEAIADKAVKLYEKLVGFIDNFELVGKEIDQAAAKWQEARKQLFSGRGNVISQGVQLKQLLGKKAGKSLPGSLLEQADE